MFSSLTKAIHLIKALSVLLSFTNDEEKILRDTLEYRMSWFGTRPKIDKLATKFTT